MISSKSNFTLYQNVRTHIISHEQNQYYDFVSSKCTDVFYYISYLSSLHTTKYSPALATAANPWSDKSWSSRTFGAISSSISCRRYCTFSITISDFDWALSAWDMIRPVSSFSSAQMKAEIKICKLHPLQSLTKIQTVVTTWYNVMWLFFRIPQHMEVITIECRLFEITFNNFTLTIPTAY